MIKEIYQYLSTPCQPVFRKLGYLSEIIAIDSKHQRLKTRWQEHVGFCHQHILSAATACGQRRKVIIVGAGLVYDVPINELATLFDEVVLVDLVFLRSTRRKLRQYNNVTLVEADVTTVIEVIACADRLQPGKPLPESRPFIPACDELTDLVVSLNLFSQLAVIPSQWLLRNALANEEDCAQWATRVMAMHLGFLSQLHCSVLVIGDMKHEYLDRHEQLVHSDDFRMRLKLPRPTSTWSWPVSPLAELDHQYSMHSQVAVWCDWHNSAYHQKKHIGYD